MKIITIIVLFLMLPLFAIAECTNAEAIDRGFTLLEGILTLCGVGGGAVALRYIRAGRATLAAVMRSLDDNPHVDNKLLQDSAQLQANLTAFKQFQALNTQRE